MSDLEQFLRGRIWLREHMPFPKEQVDAAIANGDITIKQGISTDKQCMRCLEQSPLKIIPFDCAKCEATCYYCRQCLQMRRISSCTELLVWRNPSSWQPALPSFDWQGKLTDKQKRASEEVAESIALRRPHLVYAVCGAGKTELLFPGIHEALQKGQRVCLAAPRTDVVLELSPRLRAAFPATVTHTLYGGSPEQEGLAQLVIATTHQLYRFEEAFDVVIVDEADAFPYTVDPALACAVEKARKPGAPIIYVSATPTKRLLKTIPNRSEIFSRYHGFPLPVPVYRPLWGYKKQLAAGKVPEKLKKWLQEKVNAGEPFLLFLPTIQLIDETVQLFKEVVPGIEAVHAEDPGRKEKVMQLREQKVPGLVCSTILERGITIANVQIAIVGADEALFDHAALIQISGRAGRSADFPDGEVVFFHNGISLEMDRARQLIRSYNKGGDRR